MGDVMGVRTEIVRALERLSDEQVARLWEYVQQLRSEAVAPLYDLHEKAIATGIPDLAEHHDRYLYERREELQL